MRQARRYPLVPLAMLTFLLVIPAVLAPQVAPYDPLKGSLAKRLKPPVWQEGGSIDHPLGTDKLGRDILSRMIHGARVSLAVSLVAIFVGGTLGTALGLISGYFGGWVDSLLMRLVDISLSLPTILLALVLVAAVGPSFGTVIGVLVVLLWARYARLVRGETLSIKERDFIARARVAGASHTRIMARYIFPNVVNSLIVLATLQVGYVILLESALSFLGAGLPAAHPGVGPHDRGRARADRHRLVGVDVPRAGHHADRARPEPAGRLAPRPPRSQAPARVNERRDRRR